MSLGFRPPPPHLDHGHGNLHSRLNGQRFGHCRHCTHWAGQAEHPWIRCGLRKEIIERPENGCGRWSREPGSDDEVGEPPPGVDLNPYA